MTWHKRQSSLPVRTITNQKKDVLTSHQNKLISKKREEFLKIVGVGANAPPPPPSYRHCHFCIFVSTTLQNQMEFCTNMCSNIHVIQLLLLVKISFYFAFVICSILLPKAMVYSLFRHLCKPYQMEFCTNVCSNIIQLLLLVKISFYFAFVICSLLLPKAKVYSLFRHPFKPNQMEFCTNMCSNIIQLLLLVKK